MAKLKNKIVTILLLVFIGLLFINLLLLIQKKPTPQAEKLNVPPLESTNFVGIIRPTGLSQDEKTQLNLTDINFQITDVDTILDNTYGYYLRTTQNLSQFEGKCVRVTGDYDLAWKKDHPEGSYSRTVFILNDIKPAGSCTSYPIVPSPQPGIPLQNISGTVNRITRPAPDISYDYSLKLTSPFIDYHSASGSPTKVSLIEVSPGSREIWQYLESNLGKTVALSGQILWGYAESKYFLILDTSSN